MIRKYGIVNPLPGVQGPQGPTGDIGPTGSQGQKGNGGSRGPTGDIGPTGPSGVLSPVMELKIKLLEDRVYNLEKLISTISNSQ